MGEELLDYDLIIVHYFNREIQGDKEVDMYLQAYRNSIVSYREQVKELVETGKEPMRRVRFGECDFSFKEHHKWLLEPERIVYPNIIMYI